MIQVLEGKTVVLCITGGIAAYKAATLTSRLRKLGAKVHIIMTESATHFIPPLTLEVLSENRVVTDMFDRTFTWEVEHISLAKCADVFVVAPATANIIGKAAHGIADDMVSTTLMATKAPLVIAPAMNTNIVSKSSCAGNMAQLKKRGVHFVEPESGRLACGDTTTGKLGRPSGDCGSHRAGCGTAGFGRTFPSHYGRTHAGSARSVGLSAIIPRGKWAMPLHDMQAAEGQGLRWFPVRLPS